MNNVYTIVATKIETQEMFVLKSFVDKTMAERIMKGEQDRDKRGFNYVLVPNELEFFIWREQ